MTKQSSSRSQQVLREAGERAITALLSDETFTAHVADVAIQQAINAGRLIPAERLQLGPGLTLVSTARLSGLEDAVERSIDLLEKKGGPDVDGALIVLRALEALEGPQTDSNTPPPPDTTDTAAGATGDKTDGSEKKPAKPKKAQKAKKAGKRKAIKVDVDEDGRPEGMPDADSDHECETCQTVVPGREAQIRWIKHRKILCEKCMNDQ